MPARYIIDDDTLILRNADIPDDVLTVDGRFEGNILDLLGSESSLFDENLIPSWSRSKPNMKDFLRLLLDPLEDMKLMLDARARDFGLDTAVGAQLDMIGAQIGASRTLPFAPISASRILSDADYRMLIRAKVASNAWDGTNEGALGLFNAVFPAAGITLEDRQDGTYHVTVSSPDALSDLQLEMLNAGLLLPRPAGISITVDVPQSIVSTHIIVQAGVYEMGRIAISSAE